MMNKYLKKYLFLFFLFQIMIINLEAKLLYEENIMLNTIQKYRHDPEKLALLLPIIQCSFEQNKYEQILMTTLRNKNTPIADFRRTADLLAELLVLKTIETLPVEEKEINTPFCPYMGSKMVSDIHLVSVMRSGDALLNVFTKHFPAAPINKILVQRDETTAEPIFKYMKMSPSLTSKSIVIITEPLIATGGTLSMVINLLKEAGIKESHIHIASICVSPEGLFLLNQNFPELKVVMIAMDDKLNEHKYIVPGLGDFGDRYFGTVQPIGHN